MKILISLLLIIFFSFSSCSKKPETKEIKSQERPISTTIKENISYVTAKALDIAKKSETDYVLKILILESNSDESLPNFAVVNEEITVKPRFILNDNGEIDSTDTRNINLFELSRIKKDEIVNLVITRTLKDGWLVTNFIKKGGN